MRLRNRLTTNTEVESEALPRSTRRRFLTYLDVGAASTALVSGAQALSPVAVLEKGPCAAGAPPQMKRATYTSALLFSAETMVPPGDAAE